MPLKKRSDPVLMENNSTGAWIARQHFNVWHSNTEAGGSGFVNDPLILAQEMHAAVHRLAMEKPLWCCYLVHWESDLNSPDMLRNTHTHTHKQATSLFL